MNELLRALSQGGAQQRDLSDLRGMGATLDRRQFGELMQALGNMGKGAGAGLAGMPVDLVSSAMRPFGFDVPPEDVVGSSEYLGELMGADTEGIPFMAGQFASPDPVDAVRASGHLNDLLQAMTVFHGSPHKWNKPDLSKIGTGEGAQAYGHGFYVAENPGVAKGYQEKLRKGTVPLVDAMDVTRGEEIPGPAYDFIQGYEDVDEAIKGLRATAADTPDWIRKAWAHDPKGLDALNDDYRKAADWLDANRARVSKRTDDGHFYELDLPEETIGRMLDWDRPLNEQPEILKKLTPALTKARPGFKIESLKGEDAYRTLATNAYREGAAPERSAGVLDPQKAASERLSRLGIPGIKYFDGSSRGKGEGTRNFVIFDEKDIKPLTRNGEVISE